MKKRILSMLLTACMVLSLMPVSVFAAEDTSVATKAELDAAITAAQDGDVIVLTNDIDYGNAQLKIEKAITLDLGGKTLTNSFGYGGLSLKGGCSVKNGTIDHQGGVAAIKAWDVASIEDVTITVAERPGKTVGGIVIQENAAGIAQIKDVTIKGEGLTNGIETYNCGNATAPVIGKMENVTIDAVGVAMNISAPCGTATGCSFTGGKSGIELWIKGTYSATLDLVNCTVEGGEQAVFAHDEFNSTHGIQNNGKLELTMDEDTTLASDKDAVMTLTIARAKQVDVSDVTDRAVAKVGDTYYATLDSALDASEESGKEIENLDDSIDISWYNDTETEFVLTTAAELKGLALLVDRGNTFKGKTVKLGADIDLNSELFNPIGSYRNKKAFEGIFDGQGFAIKNLSQNTWALDTGYEYSDLGLGLFGMVEDATIKSLTIDGAEISGETAICGTVAATAHGECVFENITIENAKVADYIYYAGGIVGWASGYHKYINCDVAESTTIGGQWGDFGNANGGLIGGAGTSGTYYLKDCDVACVIDCVNDYVSAYLWGNYRNSGMLIGRVGPKEIKNEVTTVTAPNVTAENCTVTFGEWAHYHYCEFAGRYPYVRVEAGTSVEPYSNIRYGHPTDANGKTVVDANHVHNEGEDHNRLFEFNYLFGGPADHRYCYYGISEHPGVTVKYFNTDHDLQTLVNQAADVGTIVLPKNLCDVCDAVVDKNIIVTGEDGAVIPVDTDNIFKVVDGGSVSIIGGTYKHKPDNYVADGYKAVQNDDDDATWSVVPVRSVRVNYYDNAGTERVFTAGKKDYDGGAKGSFGFDSEKLHTAAAKEQYIPLGFEAEIIGWATEPNQTVPTLTAEELGGRYHSTSVKYLVDNGYVETEMDGEEEVVKFYAVYAPVDVTVHWLTPDGQQIMKVTKKYTNAEKDGQTVGLLSKNLIGKAEELAPKDDAFDYAFMGWTFDAASTTAVEISKNSHEVKELVDRYGAELQVKDDGSLFINVYAVYNPKTVDIGPLYAVYKTEIYVENLEGQYVLESEAMNSAKIGDTVVAEPENRHGFKVNEGMSVLNATVAMPENPAEGETMPVITTLKVYYARNEEKVIVKAVINGDKDNAKIIFNGKAKYGSDLIAFLEANVDTDKAGYTLDKWFNGDWYGHKFAENATVNGWTNVYVTYDIIEYPVYKTIDGVREQAGIITIENYQDFDMSIPTKTGYTFNGWYQMAKDMDDPDKKISELYMAKKWELYGEFNANTYTIKYNAGEGKYVGSEPNHGENWMLIKNGYTYDQPVTLDDGTGFNRDGWTLIGWTSDKNGKSVEFELGETVEKNFTSVQSGTVQMYAVWTPNATQIDPDDVAVAYKVEHYKQNLDGSYTLAETEFPLFAQINTEVTADAKDYKGFTLAKAEPVPVEMPKDPTVEGEMPSFTTAQAYYDRNDYTITVDANEGGEVKVPGTAKYDELVSYEIVPATGYKVVSAKMVYQGDSGKVTTNLMNGDKFWMPAADVTVIVEFEQIIYNITVEDVENGTVLVQETAVYDELVSIAITPDKHFEVETAKLKYQGKNGLVTTTLMGASAFKMPAADVTIVVTFKQVSTDPGVVTPSAAAYIVNHYLEKADGGYELEKTEILSAKLGEEVEAVVKAFTGYTVSAESTLKGTVVLPDKTATDPMSTLLTLNVYYDISECTVSFNSNGGSAVASQTVEYGKTITKPADPSKSGYNFAGWYTDPGLTTAYDFTTAVTSDITLYAKWTAIAYDNDDYDSDPTYRIEISRDIDNGSVSTRVKYASARDTVTITVTPDEGYELDELTVTDSKGNEIKVTHKNGKYTFKMPARKVTIDATFVSAEEMPFADVDAGDWYYDAVKYVYDNDIMAGVGGSKFDPDAQLTRAMVAQVLYNLDEDRYTAASAQFNDVIAGEWYETAVNWVAAEKIFAGYGNGNFGTLDSVTREQLAVILYNYAVSKGYTISGTTALGMYADADMISDWAVGAVEWAVANDILRSTSALLTPNAPASRADVAYAMMQFCELF